MLKNISECFKKMRVCKGRASRSEFWYFFLFYWIISVFTAIIYNMFPYPLMRAAKVGVDVTVFITLISVSCRRLHDINRSGWWQLVPIYNIVLWCKNGNAETNRFGNPTTQGNKFNSSINMDDLVKLAKMKESGDITEEEFNIKKNQFLNN